jgi:hypothetical protein
MSHLIQAIDVEGNLLCIKHGATSPKWRTVSSLTVDNGDLILSGAEDGDEWIVTPDGGGNGRGTIAYGTCCIWKATVRFALESDSAEYSGSVTVAGTLVDAFSQSGSTGEYIDIEVDLNALGLMNRACGSVWQIFASALDGIDPLITVEIIDVTFGPPT